MSLAYVIYKWPGSQHWVYMQGEFTDLDPFKTGFVVTPFNGDSKMILAEKTEEYDVFPKQFFSSLNISLHNDSLFDPAHALETYKQALERSIQAVNAGELKKVVISRCDYFDCSMDVFADRFLSFANAYSNAFVYFLSTETYGTWFGASPEVLVTENENSFNTMALAGTIKSESDIEWKDWKQKEIDEQRYVADYMAGLFEKNSLDFHRFPTEITRTGNIHHLVSRFTLVKNQNTSLLKLAGMLHPTPAVCGLPLETSRKFILEYEKYDRSLYTGFIGPMHTETQNGFFVNLRCGRKVTGGAFLYAGGGINKGSFAEDELTETIHKMENTWRFFQ
jgi:isochorismate synthase